MFGFLPVPWFARGRLLHRSRQIASALARHGLGWLAVQVGLGDLIPFQHGLLGHPARDAPYIRPEHFRMALEELGATFIKLGQALSTRPDFVSPEYVSQLEKLRAAYKQAGEPGKDRNRGRVFGIHASRVIEAETLKVNYMDDKQRFGIGGWLRSRTGLVFLAFLAIAAFYLVTEHTAHVFGILPYALLPLCLLLHLFMHGGHNGYGAHDSHQGQAESAESQGHSPEGEKQ